MQSSAPVASLDSLPQPRRVTQGNDHAGEGYHRGVRQRFFTAPWVTAHVVVLLALVVFPILGWWQWERAQSGGGGPQNLGYALQWPAFAIILVCVWVKSMRDELGAGHDGNSTRRTYRREETRPAHGISLAGQREPSLDADDDPEVAAYNRYLAQLNAHHERYAR